MEHSSHHCNHCAEALETDTPPETKTADTHRASRGNPVLIGSAMISATLLVFAGAIVYATRAGTPAQKSQSNASPQSAQQVVTDPLEAAVIPPSGVFIPVRWGNLGTQLVREGVIDRKQFDALYADRGGILPETKKLLEESSNDQVTITPENAGQLLNLLWALGLANQNRILTEGSMQDPKYGVGDVARFASTGGWTLAQGTAMDHYSKHALIPLTTDQQALVERVAQNVYRPCCGNPTSFPDCNHGMAMLGLLQLMASQGVSETNMYRAALVMNSYWFPDTYLTIAKYLAQKGVSWAAVDPKEILGPDYSSASGYRQIVAQMTPPAETNPAPAGTVPAGTVPAATAPKRSSGGCGV